MKKVAIINGPNLNFLGIREPEIYGKRTFESYLKKIKTINIINKNLDIVYYQNNHEGEIINILQDIGFSIHGILLNAGAYSHTSIAIADTIKYITAPVIEIHITNIYNRDNFRKKSYISNVCKGMICGFGLKSYELGLISLID